MSHDVLFYNKCFSSRTKLALHSLFQFFKMHSKHFTIVINAKRSKTSVSIYYPIIPDARPTNPTNKEMSAKIARVRMRSGESPRVQQLAPELMTK